MKKTIVGYVLLLLAAVSVSMPALAGGRYADPPPGLVEIRTLGGQAAEALDKGENEAALGIVQKAQKMASEALNEKSTMPMQTANSRMRAAIKALKAGTPEEAKAPVAEVNKLFDAEIEFYKKEGKL